MIGVEVVQEIAADHLPRRTLAAESVGDKLQILFQTVLSIRSLDELDKPTDDIVLEVFVIADREDRVYGRNKGLVLGRIPRAARISEPRHVERIPPKHAADRDLISRCKSALRTVTFLLFTSGSSSSCKP